MDMSSTVAPKSNQMNADDLIAGPRTIRVSGVSGTGNADQPVAVSFDGDNGKPYLPCKSMRRVMIAAWGVDAAQYVGRSMTLYRDPKVAFGGMEVGGVRVSHMSHIERDLTLALTVTQKKRAPYSVKMLREAAPPAEPASLPMLTPNGEEKTAPDLGKWVSWCEAAIGKLEDGGAVVRWREAMQPHFLTVEKIDAGAVEHIQGKAQDRLDTIAGAA